jgi:MerR family regulatory protein/Helix-turn-helix domain
MTSVLDELPGAAGCPTMALRLAQAGSILAEAEALAGQYPQARVSVARLARGPGLSATAGRESVVGSVAEVAAWLAEPLTVSQVAALFGVTVHQAKWWATAGRLPVAGRTPRGYRLFRRADVAPLAEAWHACRDWPGAAQAAGAYGVGPEAIYRALAAGRIPGAVMAIDGRWRVPPEVLDALLAGQDPAAGGGE